MIFSNIDINQTIAKVNKISLTQNDFDILESSTRWLNCKEKLTITEAIASWLIVTFKNSESQTEWATQSVFNKCV